MQRHTNQFQAAGADVCAVVCANLHHMLLCRTGCSVWRLLSMLQTWQYGGPCSLLAWTYIAILCCQHVSRWSGLPRHSSCMTAPGGARSSQWGRPRRSHAIRSMHSVALTCSGAALSMDRPVSHETLKYCRDVRLKALIVQQR